MHVQVKISFEFICFFFNRKNLFDKIVDIFRGSELSIMYELGVEFLRVYDGKFNYREGQTVSHCFR